MTDSAFPTTTYDSGAAQAGFAVSVTDTPGLTKREYAAIHLMPSVILADDFEAPVEVLAKRAVALADAVLREAGE